MFNDNFVINHTIVFVDDCNGQGVCNSLGHCHCNEGFAPPGNFKVFQFIILKL